MVSKPIESDRDSGKVVYRFIRDNQPVTVQEIADGCFPLTFGHDDPLYGRLIKKSIARSFAAIEWLRREGGVEITCLSRPGLRSTFVLGIVAQGPEALGSSADRSVIRSFVADETPS